MAENIYNPFDGETQVIHAEWWPEGWTVTVKELSYADTKRLATAGIKATKKLPKSKKEGAQMAVSLTMGDTDIEQLKRLTMLAAIVSWTLCNGDGKPMPLNETSIRRLRARDGDFIEEAIGALNPDRSDEFQDGSAVDNGTGEGETAP
jgi:hypothetical protein